MTTNQVEVKKGRTLTTIGIIVAGLLLYNIFTSTPGNSNSSTQQHADYARDQGIATVSLLIPPATEAEIDVPATIVSRIGATTYQLAGSLYTGNKEAKRTPHSWYVQIEAIPNCFDYKRHACWVTISGPTIVQE